MDADVDVEDILQSPTSQIGRTLVLNSVSLLCKLALNVLNTTTAQVATEQAVQELLLEREEGTSLITVANHTRCVFWCEHDEYRLQGRKLFGLFPQGLMKGPISCCMQHAGRPLHPMRAPSAVFLCD